MATVFGGVTFTVRKMSDNTIVGSGTTNSEGKIVFNLPPGEYKVVITTPANHSLDKSILAEPGAASSESASTTILDVTVTEGGTTTIVTNFIQNS